MEECGSESPLSEVPSNLTEQHDRSEISARLDAYVPRNSKDDMASFLLQVFEHLGPDGRSNLVTDISECDSDEKVRQVAENIYTGVLVPMKAAGDKSSPRTGASDSVENLGAQIDESLTRDPPGTAEKARAVPGGGRVYCVRILRLQQTRFMPSKPISGAAGMCTHLPFCAWHIPQRCRAILPSCSHMDHHLPILPGGPQQTGFFPL